MSFPLNQLRPLGLKTADEIARLIGQHGGIGTMTISPDVTVFEAGEQMRSLLGQAWALQMLITTDHEASPVLASAAASAAVLVKTAQAHAAVILDGIGRAVVPDGLEATASASGAPAAPTMNPVDLCDDIDALLVMAQGLRAAGHAIERDGTGDITAGLAQSSRLIAAQLIEKLAALRARAEEARHG